MKRVRLILAVFLILLAYIFTAELYQNYFRTFYGQFYFFSLEEKEDRASVRQVLQEAAGRKNLGMFAVTSQTETALSVRINVYANESAIELLGSKYDVNQGEYASFFSGTTKVCFYPFEKIEEDDTIDTFYFTGSMEEVYSVKKIVNQTYATSYVHKGYSENNDWMIWAVWGLVFSIMLVLGWMVIQYQKKENFIKISMGMSGKFIIAKNILMDTALFIVLMFGMRVILRNFISLNYRSEGIMLIFLAFLALQIIINIAGFRYDYKEIIYGANISMKTLGNCYALKVVSMMAAIISLAICIGLISYHYYYFNMYKEIDKYEDYSFLSYKLDVSDQREGEELEQIIARKEAKLFYDMYSQGKIALAVTDIIGLNGIYYYQVNENTLGVENLINGKIEEDFHGFYILIPNSMIDKEKIAEHAFEAVRWDYEGFDRELGYRIITYDNSFSLLYFDTGASNLEFGFDMAENPVMILRSFDFKSLDKEAACVYLNGIQNDVMYRLDGMKATELQEKYGLKSVVITSVPERCAQYRAAILRVIILNAIIFLFMFLLEVVIIMTIIKMEYVVNAKELAIKKILGYTIIKKNEFLFFTNLASALAAISLVLVYSIMYDVVSIPLIVVAAIVLVVAEMVLIYSYIIKTEWVQTAKILKGGSL